MKYQIPTARVNMPTFTSASTTTVREELYEEVIRLRYENKILKQRLLLWGRE